MDKSSSLAVKCLNMLLHHNLSTWNCSWGSSCSLPTILSWTSFTRRVQRFILRWIHSMQRHNTWYREARTTHSCFRDGIQALLSAEATYEPINHQCNLQTQTMKWAGAKSYKHSLIWRRAGPTSYTVGYWSGAVLSVSRRRSNASS